MNTARGRKGTRRRRKWTRADIRVVDPTVARHSIAGTAIGNFMEWYDFGVYGYIATTIGSTCWLAATQKTPKLTPQRRALRQRLNHRR